MVSMLSEVQPEEQSGLSGSISVEADAASVAAGVALPDHNATIPHIVHFEATLDENVDGDDRTMISDPPVQPLLDALDAPESGDALSGSEEGGFRVRAEVALPPRPGHSSPNPSFIDHATDHRLTLLKFIALGVGIGATLLMGLIFLSK